VLEEEMEKPTQDREPITSLVSTYVDCLNFLYEEDEE